MRGLRGGPIRHWWLDQQLVQRAVRGGLVELAGERQLHAVCCGSIWQVRQRTEFEHALRRVRYGQDPKHRGHDVLRRVRSGQVYQRDGIGVMWLMPGREVQRRQCRSVHIM